MKFYARKSVSLAHKREETHKSERSAHVMLAVVVFNLLFANESRELSVQSVRCKPRVKGGRAGAESLFSSTELGTLKSHK
jgi:hypothetical protein